MEIVDVEIAPFRPAHVTPLELIEDFADVVPNWHFLEEDSLFYAAARGRNACVIRTWNAGRGGAIDFAFVQTGNDEPAILRLALLCPTNEVQPLQGAARSSCLQRFIDAFESYLTTSGASVSIRAVSAESTEPVSA